MTDDRHGPERGASAQSQLAAAADWLWTTCDLGEDEDLDPDDVLEVIRRAYTSSDCDDFSYMLHLMTGWPVVRAAWKHPAYGIGHHSLVQAPDGRLLDVNGWTDEHQVAAKYRPRSPQSVTFKQVEAVPMLEDDDHQDGISEAAVLRAGVIRNLPYAPYDQADFQAMSSTLLVGVDFPIPDEETTPTP